MALFFRWNVDKAAINLKKHGVSFQEALSVFGDPLARIFDDEAHSVEELREIIIGQSREQRLLVVSFNVSRSSGSSARGRRRNMSARITKKVLKPHRGQERDELRAEYRFDYSKAKPNRFAAAFRGETTVVVLDPDVAAVFADAESVNSALRAAITHRPARRRAKKRAS